MSTIAKQFPETHEKSLKNLLKTFQVLRECLLKFFTESNMLYFLSPRKKMPSAKM